MAERQKVRISARALAVANTLCERGALERYVLVASDMPGAELRELRHAGVIKREGMTAGRYGSRGKVRLTCSVDQLESKATRSRSAETQQHIAGDRGPASSLSSDSLSQDISISALERFVQVYRSEEEPVLRTRRKTIEERIEQIQRHLAIAKGDDFRNTMAMANSALRALDEVDREVSRSTLQRVNPGPNSPIYPIWRALCRAAGSATVSSEASVP